MKWFRLWHEWGHDPKVQAMPEVMQRRHVMLLCLRRQVDTSELSDQEIAHYMRIDMETLNETKELFEKKGFIDNGWDVLAWETRQFDSDSSTGRTRKYRKRQKKKKGNVTGTSQKRHGDAIDTDTETDKDYTPKFHNLWGLYPRKIEKKLALKKYNATIKKGADYQDLLKAVTNYAKAMAGREKEHIKHGATFFGPNEPWKEWVEGSPEGFSGVHTGPAAEDPHKDVRCKRCTSWWSTMERNEEGLCESCAEAVSRN